MLSTKISITDTRLNGPKVHRENHTVYFQPERAPTQKQEHRQDTEDRANNAYTEKRGAGSGEEGAVAFYAGGLESEACLIGASDQ